MSEIKKKIAKKYLSQIYIFENEVRKEARLVFLDAVYEAMEDYHRQQMEEVIEQLKKDYHESGDVEFALWKLQSKLQDNE